MSVPLTHPRYHSLMMREKLIEGWEKGVVATAGLMAHGRGEAFDYLLGEKTIPQAEKAEKVAAVHLLNAEHPVISVNGNTAVLAGRECVELAALLGAPLEVNLFYWSEKRVRSIVEFLKSLGAESVLGLYPDRQIPGIEHRRGRVCSEGIYRADVVLVPLEDGDRTQALVNMGKCVIAVDLNPLSRTSQSATVSIVDNVTRAIPILIKFVKEFKSDDKRDRILHEFNNQTNLGECLRYISQQLMSMG